MYVLYDPTPARNATLIQVIVDIGVAPSTPNAVFVPHHAMDKFFRALAQEVQLQETLRTGLPTKSRGGRLHTYRFGDSCREEAGAA